MLLGTVIFVVVRTDQDGYEPLLSGGEHNGGQHEHVRRSQEDQRSRGCG